ncbi:endonuclease/exonuclease/phosphatase family protein [Photobacterium sanctipauli]|uniref:Endonuclease/exonuclease/phosphatase family protein n=1 Tax=Photobacterium sanctipauli TaxID=1342794 RepID=A0A2T3NP42_9GAMM|nr:endonuclease/exonuclease/phosphatase family protein [Photobacterium sanctipauli]PSW17685.1 endonuclease/exonuclease/phosphatase family protein [Photobacterium sanctipauli]
MSLPEAGAIRQQLLAPDNPRFSKLAAIIQNQRPDILMLCEFDHPGNGGDDGALADFCHRYLGVAQHDQQPIDYPYRYCPPTNTGLASEYDLDGDGEVTLPNDAHGFGEHHGHFGFVILSRFPIVLDSVRSWQHLLWQSLPDNQMPVGYYSEAAVSTLRLSSKNHLLVPVKVGDEVLHLICAHPTPPVFDGDEKRNARRNHDELKLLQAIIDDAAYLVDDNGHQGGLKADSKFVVLGDLNADRQDGDGMKSAISELLFHPRIYRSVASGRMTPKSLGGRFLRPWQARKGRASEWTHISGLRLDYVLPSANLNVLQSGVFWPDKKDALRHLITDERGRERPQAGSDHRMVSVDIAL